MLFNQPPVHIFEATSVAAIVRSDPASGGKPLSRIAVLSVLSRRLPGITQNGIKVYRLNENNAPKPGSPVRLQHHKTFPGAAC
jgi:hypothetical protein